MARIYNLVAWSIALALAGGASAQEMTVTQMERIIDSRRPTQPSAVPATRGISRGLVANDHENDNGGTNVYPDEPVPERPQAETSLFNLHILFHSGSAELDYRSLGQVRDLAEAIAQPRYREMIFKIVGHTDSVGSAAVNQKLSEERADAVVRVLVTYGVSPKQLSSEGRGKSQPLDWHEGPNPINRRVEILLVN